MTFKTRESRCAKKADNQRLRHANLGIREEECKTLRVVESKSAQQVAARDVPGVVEHESAQ